jgi:dethiobiotin synthetase
LGCISSTISNVLAFEKYKVRLDLLVLNTQKKNDMDNLKEIKKYTDIPIVNYTKISDIKTIKNKINKIL